MVEFTYNHSVDSELFVGRTAILSDLTNRLNSTVLLGEARIGKTSLLLHLKHLLAKLDERSRRQIPIYLNLRWPTLTCPADVYQALAARLATDELIPRNVARKIKPEKIRSSTQLLALLEELSLRSVRVVPVALLDNIDQPQEFLAERLELYSGLRQLLDFAGDSTPLKIVASASPSFLDVEPFVVSKLLGRLRQVYIGALSDSEVAALIGRSDDLSASREYSVVLKYLIDATGGHPCLLQELVVKTLDRRQEGENVLQRLEAEAQEITERGGSFFQSYIKELSFQELLYLLPIAFGTPAAEWQAPTITVKRFSSAGLLRESPDGRMIPGCTLFFRWFLQNVRLLLPSSGQPDPRMSTAEGLVAWLRIAVATALAGFRIGQERELNGVLRGILVGSDLTFKVEDPIRYKSKVFKVDLVIPHLSVAIELKWVSDGGRVGHIIDELEVDALAYLEHFRHLVVIIAVPASGRLQEYAKVARNPYIHFILCETVP